MDLRKPSTMAKTGVGDYIVHYGLKKDLDGVNAFVMAFRYISCFYFLGGKEVEVWV